MRQELFRPCSSLGDTRKYSERFIGITKAWGRPQRIEVLAAEVSPHPPFDVRVEGTRAESERREAPSGRARSTTEVRAGGLVLQRR